MIYWRMYFLNLGDEKSNVYFPPGQNDMLVQIFLPLSLLLHSALKCPAFHVISWANPMLFQQALLFLNTDGFTLLCK